MWDSTNPRILIRVGCFRKSRCFQMKEQLFFTVISKSYVKSVKVNGPSRKGSPP